MFTFEPVAFWAERVLEVPNAAYLSCWSWTRCMDELDEQFRTQHNITVYITPARVLHQYSQDCFPL